MTENKSVWIVKAESESIRKFSGITFVIRVLLISDNQHEEPFKNLKCIHKKI